jgi:hypothetical protein
LKLKKSIFKNNGNCRTNGSINFNCDCYASYDGDICTRLSNNFTAFCNDSGSSLIINENKVLQCMCSSSKYSENCQESLICPINSSIICNQTTIHDGQLVFNGNCYCSIECKHFILMNGLFISFIYFK